MPIVLVELGERDEETTVITGKNILLKLFEEKDKETWLASPAVRNALNYSEYLCNEDARKHVSAILDTYERQKEVCREVLETPFGDIADSRDIRLLSEFLRKSDMRLDFWQPRKRFKSQKQKKENEKRYFEAMTWQLIQTISRDFETRLKRNDKEMARHEKELQKDHPNLHLLKPTNILVCPKCRQPLLDSGTGEFDAQAEHLARPPGDAGKRLYVTWGEIKGTTKCQTCKTDVTRKIAHRIPVHEIDENLVKMFRQNLWFEEYVAKAFESLGWKVWKRPRVMGMSGILHEVDAVGIRNGYTVCVECKTGKKINREEVFTFAVKLSDIKAHFGVLAMLGSPAESETREFLAKNPAMLPIEGIAGKNRAALIQELKSSTLGKI